MALEQRQSPRTQMVVRVDYPDDPKTVDWTENISASGVLIRSQRPLAVGQVFRFSLTFPKRGEPVALTGAIVWIRQNGVRGLGVRIDSPQQRKQLADYLLQEVAERSSAASYRVFIAEDSPHLKEMLRRSLGQMTSVRTGAVELSFFDNGHDALMAANESFPDLVVTDLDMPVMDGLSLIRRLRIHPGGEGIGILAMGARDVDEDQQALKAGADGFLPKPFDVGQLVTLIADQLLGKHADIVEAPVEILIVDDESDNIGVLERTLHGRRMMSFTDPHQALAAAKTIKPKVLLVDYRMPELDGVALVESLRQSGEGRCAVIMVTAFPDLDEVVYARQNQLFYRIVPKPVDPTILREQVATAIDEYDRKDESLRRFLRLEEGCASPPKDSQSRDERSR